MRNALVIYTNQSGHGQFHHHEKKIRAFLASQFDQVDYCCTSSAEEGRAKCQEACGVYHTLVIVGGDGTFHNAINALAERENTPVLAYINSGTIGDIGHNFGITKSYKSALKAIKKGNIVPFDIGKIGETYFGYVAAIGSYADIPYDAPREKKKKLGVIAYYYMAFKQLFHLKKVHTKVIADGVTYEADVPFVLLMNGKHVGGFWVNNRGNIFDGKFDLFLTKPGLFNGLAQWLMARNTIKHISATDIYIHTEDDMAWDLDGERGPTGDIHATIIHNALKIYSLTGPKKERKK